MLTMRSPLLRRPGFAWVLWLALLLPLAQASAAWHAVTHVGAALGDAERDVERDADIAAKHAPHLAHCDLCLTAAGIGGAAFAGAPTPTPHPALRHQAPQRAFAGVWAASAPRAYRSRAPPLSSR